MRDAHIFGVLSGSVDAPRVAYLKKEAVIPAARMPPTPGIDPVEAFRFGARCEEGRCAQYADGRCSLGQRLVDGLEPVVDALPSCTLRPSCRWFFEQGNEACVRCPQVVTLVPKGSDRLSRAAALPESVAR